MKFDQVGEIYKMKYLTIVSVVNCSKIYGGQPYDKGKRLKRDEKNDDRKKCIRIKWVNKLSIKTVLTLAISKWDNGQWCSEEFSN